MQCAVCGDMNETVRRVEVELLAFRIDGVGLGTDGPGGYEEKRAAAEATTICRTCWGRVRVRTIAQSTGASS